MLRTAIIESWGCAGQIGFKFHEIASQEKRKESNMKL